MALIQQLVCGRNPASPDSGRSVLSHSPGMGAAVTDEILRFCSGWGSTPQTGLARPAVLSFPLKATMPSIRGQLYAIIRVTTGVPACFHAVVMSKVDFRGFGYNPFSVVKAGSFLDSWDGGERVAQGRIEPPPPESLFSPPPNPADVGIVDEALQQFLAKGRLVLNLEAATPESDRALDLVIHLMPTTFKEKLRFASYAPQGDNSYTLAAAYAKNTPFSSWQRLFMTLIDQAVPESVRKYIATVRNGLTTGDLAGVNRSDSLRESRPMETPGRTQQALEPLSSQNVPLNRDLPGSKPALSTMSIPHPRRTTAAIVPMTAGLGDSERKPGPGRAPVSGAGKSSGRAVRSRLVRQSMPLGGGRRGGQSHILATVIILVLVLAAGWVYLDRSGMGERWGLPDLASRFRGGEARTKAATLLEVVDVGAEYSRQLGRIQKAKLMPGADRQQALRRAMAQLQAEAAGPLLLQADLFLKLVDNGIQQGHRPDREKDRLKSLDNQGQVLITELGRLELAYYSFQQGILWQDLDFLPDAAVMARRDSLLRTTGTAMTAVSREVGAAPYWSALQGARRNASGMATLLSLFQARTWTREWEREMKRAAEKVSPTASPMSRAYRNNAFTLVRLKHAERQESNLTRAFSREFGRGVWPSPAVKDVLQELRRKAALFDRDEMPVLLADILAFYAKLEDPVPLARATVESDHALAELRQNTAVVFDPGVYENYLDRIRFEALLALLETGVEEEHLPEWLTGDLDPALVVRFNDSLAMNENLVDWQALAAEAGDGFLGRWSLEQDREVTANLAFLNKTFDKAWDESLVLTGKLGRRCARGEDWTSVWVDLHGEIDKILANSPAVVQADSARAARWVLATELKTGLEVARPLDLESVVVRLEQEVLAGPCMVTVEFQVGKDGPVRESSPLGMGPAAPEGTGWVGTTSLDWAVDISPLDDFTVRVLSPDHDLPLLEIHYPSLSERMGPGSLVRPRRVDGGSLVFRMGDRWWRELPLLSLP